MGWALQKPGLGGKRHSPHVKDYLKARFDVREQSEQKADPQKVSKDMRHAPTEEKKTSILEKGIANKKPGAIILFEAVRFKTLNPTRFS